MHKYWKTIFIVALLLFSIWGKIRLPWEMYYNDGIWRYVIEDVFHISFEYVLYLIDAALCVIFVYAVTKRINKSVQKVLLSLAITAIYILAIMAFNYTLQWIDWVFVFGREYSPLDFAKWGLISFASDGHPYYIETAILAFGTFLLVSFRSNILSLVHKKAYGNEYTA